MMLERHNISRLRERAAEAFPHLTLAQVETLPFAERKAAGVVLPYEIATLPFPYGFEQSHIMLVGTTGTGKTTVLRRLVAQAIERGDRCVIRSEEHTSELQSLMRISYAVFCLKKKKKIQHTEPSQ